jgi:glycosyltransferase involved in cell wall biosynthesis
MHIGVDLRGLNFELTTGIGSYTMALLKHLPAFHNYTFIGVKEELQSELISLSSGRLHIEFVSMKEYTGLSLYKMKKISTLVSVVLCRLSIYNDKCMKFDYLILPQPKPLQIHPNTKVITVIHDLYGVMYTNNVTFKQRLIENKTLYKKLCTVSTKVVVNSYATGYDLTRFLSISEDKISLIYPSDLSQLNTNTAKEDTINENYFLAISGIEPRKNWLIMIRAFKQFALQHPKFKLLLVGKPVNQKYLQLVRKEINNHPNIELMLNTTEAQKVNLLANCHALLYASYYEGFGFPLLEAGRFSKPVITSKISSMPEVAGKGGVYISPFSQSEFVSAMTLVVEDTQYYDQLCRLVRENYIRFSWKEFACLWDVLLK